jgi:5-methylcytosine-specific restriction endonuclease McrA
MSINRLVLVLNASYEAVTICTARRAITLVMKGAAVVEEISRYTIRTPRVSVPVPSVVRLRTYRKVPRLKRSVSRKGIILRDASGCQYCGRKFESRELTLDHVIPRSRGGQSTWENLVASCVRCNNRKGNRTPQEAGMQLLRAPRPIGIHAKHRLLAGDDHGAWDKYLFC